MSLFVCEHCRSQMCTNPAELSYVVSCRLEKYKQAQLSLLAKDGKKSNVTVSDDEWFAVYELAADGRCEKCGAFQDGLTEIATADELNPFADCVSEEEIRDEAMEIEKRQRNFFSL